MENRTITIIEAKGKFDLGFKELFTYKDLFFTLAWRDFRVRYAQTLLGLAWAVIQPLLTLTVLYLIFSKLTVVNTYGTNQLAFTMAGTTLWGFFAYVLSNAGSSIIGAQQIVKKIYFPRLLIPLSKAVVGFIDFGLSFIILLGIILYFNVTIPLKAFFCVFYVFTTICASLGIGIWLSALTIRYRDFQYIVPFLVQLGLYVSPIGYPIEFAIHNLPKWLSAIYFLNPMAGNVHGFRYYLFGNGIPPNSLTFLSIFMSFLLLLTGLLYFKKVEKDIADIV